MPANTAASPSRAAHPLVSIVVRSMGRPELRLALEALAAQDYPSLEVIVVDATGGRHPPLPTLDWRDGHALRLVSRAEPLPRPLAANVGLDAVKGSWFSFLDDDDTCAPEHVSTLVNAVRAHPDALVVYGAGRLFDEQGRLQQVFGRPFNRALMHFGPLFYWQASLISTRARDLGCRFDPALAVCEDRDFIAQVARHGDLVFVPSATTFRYRPDLGTSGTGQGVNRDAARVARYENLLRAKWAGNGTFHNERVAWRCREGVRAYRAGDLAGARASFEEALAAYPDDPNALHGLARVALATGRRDDAAHFARRALAINPEAAEFRATVAEIEGRSGTVRPRTADAGATARGTPSRNAPCPCGSGLRYKACHGLLGRGAEALPPTRADGGAASPADAALAAAQTDRETGNAYAARERLRVACATPSRAGLLAAARLALDLGDAADAFPLLERAAALFVDREAGLMLEECCAGLARGTRDRALWSTILELTAASRRNAGPALHGTDGLCVIVAAADTAAAQRLGDTLGARARVATEGARDLAGASTLVLFDAAIELTRPRAVGAPARVVVRMNRDDPESLVRSLARVADAYPGARLDVTRPFAEAAPDDARAVPVDYPWIDAALLDVAPAPARADAAVTVGRTWAPGGADDHPNDPALYRALAADGHRVMVTATPFLERAFRDDPKATRPTFRPPAAPGADLPDVVLHRGRPGHRGASDVHLLEAMAAARPVVVFADAIGAREWLRDGANGFVVADEQAARSCILRLARDARLRALIGRAARETARELVEDRRDRARAFYLGVSV